MSADPELTLPSGSIRDQAKVGTEEPPNKSSPGNEPESSHGEEESDSSVSKKANDNRIEALQYHITRQSDQLVIATWTDINHNQSNKSALYSGCTEFQDPRTITLRHFEGESFIIPWSLCTKWTWMKDIIKLSYGMNEIAKKEIDEGKFVVTFPFDSQILPEHWDTVIKPWAHVTITLQSQKVGEKTDQALPTTGQSLPKDVKSPPDKKSVKTVYESRVSYTLTLYQKGMYGNEENYLRTLSYSHPVSLEKSNTRNQVVPVLEEISRVVFGKDSTPALGANPDDLVLDVSDYLKPKKLHIRSPLLLNALRYVAKYSSNPAQGEENEAFTNGLFTFPFKDLYYHREELLSYQTETTGARANHTLEYNKECDEHINVLLDYLENEPKIQLKSIHERWARKVPTTTFSGFWLLMKPGSDVYVQENGQLNAYVIDLVSGGIDHSDESFFARPYSVRVWNLVSDGKTIRRKPRIIQVPVFDGERDIVSLPLFPTSFYDKLDTGILRQNLIRRGKNFFRYARGPTFLEYTGSGLKPGWKKYNRARVVVEHQSLPWSLPEFQSLNVWNLSDEHVPPVPFFFNPRRPPPPPSYGEENKELGERARAPRCECSSCKSVESREGVSISTTYNGYDDIDPSIVKSLTDHQALISMSHMFAFILKERSYDLLDINGLSEPVLAENAIDELVLRPEKNKNTIKAIAKTYTDSDSQADLFSVDFIRGKGEGQIFLLHGPPGTGKTLTAESVAEYTKRPLLSITAADLGHEPVELETNLLRFFKNATAWDAIVLLDEADVYLERRSSNDLRRNSIVSIFLRALDYFEGILFFTTNRVGQFDEAFMSRIHVSIGYDPLDDKAREQIWDTLFRKLKSSHKNGSPQIEYEYDAKQYVRKSDDVKRLKWNGREIRNAFQTAVALAIADSKTARAKGRPEDECVPQVTEAHLSQVVSMSAAFKRYIKATHEGVDESDLAYRLGNRYDRLDPESP